MNIGTMHAGVSLGLQRVASFVYEKFDPEEIDYFLNDASMKFVQEAYSKLEGGGPDAYNAVSTINKSVALSATLESENVWSVVLPEDYDFYVYSRVGFEGSGYAEGKHSTFEEMMHHAPNVHDNAVYRAIPVARRGENLLLVPSVIHGTPETLYLSYLKHPVDVRLDADPELSVDSDLPRHVHQLIVDLAVRLITESLKNSTAPTK